MSISAIIINVVSAVILIVWIAGAVRTFANEAKERKEIHENDLQNCETANDNR